METLRSYAKLNLSLLVYRPRADGYHPVCSLFQQISVHDTISIRDTIDKQCTVRVPGSSLDNQPNILHRLYDLVAPRLTMGLEITLQKTIPMGAGLGGGSSNAGTVLSWLLDTGRLRLSTRERVRVAMSLGADVPFFLIGGTALVRGIGEKMIVFNGDVPSFYVVVNPGIESPTAEVYRQFDIQFPDAPRPSKTPHRILNGAIGENSFKPVVWSMIPTLAQFDEWARNTFGQSACLSGSGSTVFFAHTSHTSATAMAVSIRTQFPHFWVVVATPIRDKKWVDVT